MENRVFLASCADYDTQRVEQSVRRIFDNFNFLQRVSGRRVLLKPNLIGAHSPDKAATTHPSVVQAAAKLLVEAGASVIIADSAGGQYTRDKLARLYRVTGMQDAVDVVNAAKPANTPDVTLNYDTSHEKRGRFNIIKPALEADIIITIAKLKTHGYAYYTGAVKNLYGCIPGLEKATWHSRLPSMRSFSAMLIDLCEQIKPSFALVDGVVGMEGAGPTAGSPRYAGAIGGAENPYALDFAMCRIAGLPHRLIPLLTEASRRGLFNETVIYEGDDIACTTFKPAIAGGKNGLLGTLISFIAPWLGDRHVRANKVIPVVKNSCTGCGACAEACPRNVIDIKNNRAEIKLDGCIRCYCCHEMCPARAIDLVKNG